MILHGVVMIPLTSHSYKAGTEHAGFSPKEAVSYGRGREARIWWDPPHYVDWLAAPMYDTGRRKSEKG